MAAGANPKEVAARAGHTSVSFTLDRYGHLFPDDLDAVADAFDSAADDLRTITRSPRSRLERESSLSWLFKVGLTI